MSDKPEVLYINAETGWEVTLLDKLEHLFNEYLGDLIKKDDRVLLKTHFGQWGNMATFRPSIMRKLVDLVRDKGAYPVLAETTGLGYGILGRYGGRGTATDYLRMAASQGFTMGTMGAPIGILDGELGVDTFPVEIDGDSIKKVAVARGAIHFDQIIIFSHAKGHPIGGIGGAIKNLGIGMVGKYSKGMAHFGTQIPKIDPEKCLGEECQACFKKCPTQCLGIRNNVATVVKPDDCVLCSHCVSVCRQVAKKNAVSLGWITDNDEQARRFAENAAGVVKGLGAERLYYINVLIDTSPMCDCVNHTPYRMTQDIGLLASDDPVAIDQACVDMINRAPNAAGPNTPLENIKEGDDKLAYAHAKKDKDGNIKLSTGHITQLTQAEKMGLGKCSYSLKEIEIPSKKKE